MAYPKARPLVSEVVCQVRTCGGKGCQLVQARLEWRRIELEILISLVRGCSVSGLGVRWNVLEWELATDGSSKSIQRLYLEHTWLGKHETSHLTRLISDYFAGTEYPKMQKDENLQRLNQIA